MNPIIQSSNQNFSGNASSCVIGKPSGLAIGDLWTCHFFYRDTAQTITAPAGWALLDIASTNSGMITIRTFYKIATAGDVAGASPILSASTNVLGYAFSSRINGQDAIAPVSLAVQSHQDGVDVFTSSNSVVPVSNSSLILFAYYCLGSVNSDMGNSGDTAFGTPQGTITNIQNFIASAGGFQSGTLVYDARINTASTNGFICNPASNFADWVGTMLVVNSATPGGGGGDFFPLMT